jgi:hypothetical protein
MEIIEDAAKNCGERRGGESIGMGLLHFLSLILGPTIVVDY